MPRTSPNIVIAGTPGVGKSSHCELLAESTGLRHLSVNQIVKDKSCHEGYDDELKTWIVDEDKLLDEIEPQLEEGGNIIDWHVCEIFPERLIDLVVVLRVDSKLLYDRLKARDYPDKKLQENLDSEIMQVILEEARYSYNENIVIELRSDNSEEIDSNVERITEWVNCWKSDHPDGV
ncbi:P-loop containing nucleoside triphosphate hydrolase protein [Wilcoxina mikolae CBS 423.85]|nr:P-loop containing nucleoside triphosphate hydrolase protein [Wilcoxina mikolae CBS 423.85]